MWPKRRVNLPIMPKLKVKNQPKPRIYKVGPLKGDLLFSLGGNDMQEFTHWLQLASQPGASLATEKQLQQQMVRLGFDRSDFEALLAVVVELRVWEV